MAIEGNVVVIGALLDSTYGTNAGAAYVFRYNGVSWQAEAKVLPSGNATGDKFGIDVDVSGDAMIVGANLDDALGTDSGSATVFRKAGAVAGRADAAAGVAPPMIEPAAPWPSTEATPSSAR